MTNNKKMWARYITVFLIAIISYSFGRLQLKSPEEKIIGKWNEVAWEYERVGNKSMLSDNVRDSLAMNVYSELSETKCLHGAKKWEFLPNGTLVLYKNGQKEIGRWKVKGRGNVLEIKFQDEAQEQYDLKELTQQKLVLNNNVEHQIKGMARWTFRKS